MIFILLLMWLYLSKFLHFPPTPPISQFMPSSGDLEKEIVPKPLQVFIRRSKNLIFISLHVDPESITADPDSFYFALCLLLFYFLLLRWILLPLETWIFLLHIERVNDLVPNIIFLFFYDNLTPLCHQFALFVSSVSIPKSY